MGRLQFIQRKAIALKNSWIGLTRAPFSRLFLASDRAGWALDYETLELRKLLIQLGVPTHMGGVLPSTRQSVHFSDQFELRWLLNRSDLKYRYSVDYFHGKPGTEPAFTELFDLIRQKHSKLSRVRVTHTEMRDYILDTGIDPVKVHLIRTGIDLSLFPHQTPALKRTARDRLGIPHSAAVIGSFQKDGVGWDDSEIPKLIKGPDIFLKAIEILKTQIPELWVLLTGPARGYVKKGLRDLGVPFTHRFLEHYSDVGQSFLALDAYIVSSRQDGAPKAVLESMAAGVPLITTRVGQAMDLVKTGENGWMVDVEDSEGLAHFTALALRDSQKRTHCIEQAFRIAHENRYGAELPDWKKLLEGYCYFSPDSSGADPIKVR